MAKNMNNQSKNMKNQTNGMNNRSDKAQPPYEPAENVKPPIESCKDMRNRQKNGGRSTPNKADAPDGISGNWQ